MSRLDYKRGRFNPDLETDRIFQAMAGWQEVDGDYIDWYHFDPVNSEIDEVYDEPAGAGLFYYPPVRVEALHVMHQEGGNENSENGFYYNDTATAIVAFDKFTKAGFDAADVNTGNYLKDRILYDRKIFNVSQISIRGQMQKRDVIVAVTFTQCKPDELVNDTQFANWAPDGLYTLQGGTQ